MTLLPEQTADPHVSPNVSLDAITIHVPTSPANPASKTKDSLNELPPPSSSSSDTDTDSPSTLLKSDSLLFASLNRYLTFSDFSQVLVSFLKKYWGILAFLLIQIVGLALLATLAFQPLSWKAWYAFAVLCGTLAILASNAFTPMIAMTLAVAALLIADVIPPQSAFTGLSNQGTLTVVIFFIIAEGIRQTSVLTSVFQVLLGRPKTLVEAQARMIIPITMVSSFLYNTPLVAMLTPVVQAWSRRTSFPVSQLLMPMNFAATVGGTLTMLGTSTNSVLDGLVIGAEVFKTEDGRVVGLPVFGISPVGAIVAATGVLYLILFSRFLRRDGCGKSIGALIQNARKYNVSFCVTSNSSLAGMSVKDTGLHHLKGLFLVSLTRSDGTVLTEVEPETVIEAGDVLLFACEVDTVTDLYHIHGVEPATEQSKKLGLERRERRLIEVGISESSDLIDRSVRESCFRSRFGGVVIGVCGRDTFEGKAIVDMKLSRTDRLLVEGDATFCRRCKGDSNFWLLKEVIGSQPPREDLLHKLIVTCIVVGMIGIAAAEILPLSTAAAAASFVLIATGCLTIEQAGRSINWTVMITIAAGFGISSGLSETGGAAELGKFILRICKPLGETGLLIGIYFATALITSVISSNAAVALMFPVVLEILQEETDAQVSHKLRALYALMLGGSSSFATPIAFQTNLMVHGPGGYTFFDWMKFGIPLQIIIGVVSSFALHALQFSL